MKILSRKTFSITIPILVFLVIASITFFVFTRRSNSPTTSIEKISYINLYSDKFSPNTLAIKINESVEFDSKDGGKHTIVQGKGDGMQDIHNHDSNSSLQSKEFNSDEGYRVNFKQVGTYFFSDTKITNDYVTVVVYDPVNPAKIQ